MPSKGNPVLHVRVSRDLYAKMMEAIQQRNENTTEEPWIFSDFIELAIAEKIAKMARSQGKKMKRPAIRTELEMIREIEAQLLRQAT